LPVRLFIGNLPYDATDVELREHLSSYGAPTHVALPTDRETGRPRGFAFVEFADRETAETVIRNMNGQPFRGRPLAVSEARPREERSGPRPLGGGRPPASSSWARPAGGTGGPRPAGAPGAFAPRGPRMPGEAPGGPPAGRARNFGPPAKPKGKGGSTRWRDKSEGPKGPIKVRGGGRIYDVDEIEAPTDEPADFEDFATSRPQDEEEGAVSRPPDEEEGAE
jgi:RNA recognition motif-containing protein